MALSAKTQSQCAQRNRDGRSELPSTCQRRSVPARTRELGPCYIRTHDNENLWPPSPPDNVTPAADRWVRAPHEANDRLTTEPPLHREPLSSVFPLKEFNCLKVKQRFPAFFREFPRTSSGTSLLKSENFKGSLGFAHRRFCDFAFSYSETHTRISTHVLETKVPRSVSGNLTVFRLFSRSRATARQSWCALTR